MVVLNEVSLLEAFRLLVFLTTGVSAPERAECQLHVESRVLSKEHLAHFERGRRVAADEGRAEAHGLVTVEVHAQLLTRHTLFKD